MFLDKTLWRHMRLLGATAAAALAAGLLPLGPVHAAIAVDDACPSTTPEDGFTDTGPEGSAVEAAVDCLVATGITAGTSPITFGVRNPVSRGQLATFVLNVLDRVDGFVRPANVTDAFTDDDGSVHEENINDAAALGLIAGYGDGTFGPGATVDRGQMATFIVRVIEEAGVPVSDGPDAFTDDADSVHRRNIDRLARLDVVDGEADGTYNARRPVTRGTMAFFLTRTLEVLVDAGAMDGTEPVPGGPLAPAAPTGVSARAATGGAEISFSATGSPTSFTVYRAASANSTDCATTTAAAYTALVGVTSSPYTDLTTTTPGRYCYVVTARNGTAESERSTAAFLSLAVAGGGATTAPTLTDVRAQDGGVSGVLDAGDVHQLTFSRPLAATADDNGERYVLEDGSGAAVSIICGSNAACVLQGTGSFGGSVLPANQVLRIFLNGILPRSEYPATITDVSLGFADVAGEKLELGMQDTVLNVEVISPAAVNGDTDGPTMGLANADPTLQTITIRYMEPVVCENTAAVAAAFSYSRGTLTDSPRAVACDGTPFILLTFAEGVLDEWDAEAYPMLYYSDEDAEVDVNDIRDLSGNQAFPEDSRAVHY